MLLYLVRHGETVYNVEGRIQGQSDSPLTLLGIRQAEAIAGRLMTVGFSSIYSSDLGRAFNTAQIIASLNDIRVETSENLRERCFGCLEGLRMDEIEQQYPSSLFPWRNSHTLPPIDGESKLEVVERAREFVDDLRINHQNSQNVLAVGHGGSLRGIIVAVCNMDVERWRMFKLSNASLSILDLDDNSIHLLNDTSHLDWMEVTEQDADDAR
jgi:phosphoserine phosphatase